MLLAASLAGAVERSGSGQSYTEAGLLPDNCLHHQINRETFTRLVSCYLTGSKMRCSYSQGHYLPPMQQLLEGTNDAYLSPF